MLKVQRYVPGAFVQSSGVSDIVWDGPCRALRNDTLGSIFQPQVSRQEKYLGTLPPFIPFLRVRGGNRGGYDAPELSDMGITFLTDEEITAKLEKDYGW